MSRRWRVALGLAPALTLLAALLGSALFGSLAQSLGHAPAYGVREFPTLRYYAAVLGDPAVGAAALRTLALALPATALALALGAALGLAWPRTASPARTLGSLPLLVPYVVVVALASLWLSNGGVLARVLAALGLIGAPHEFPRLLDGAAGVGTVLTFAWKQVPFGAVLVASARAGADPDLDDVARVFGASRMQRLRYVAIPQVMPALLAAGVLGLAYNLGALEVPLLLDGGTRDTLAVAAWRAYADPDLSQRPQAMAIAWLLSIGAVAVVAFASALARRRLPGATP